MRRLLPCLALLLAACAPGDDTPAPDAPTTKAAVQDEISGVGGATWGTTGEQLIARHGTPAFDDTGFDGVRVLGYQELLAGQTAQLLYMVHPRRGLFRGGYLVPVSTPAQCGVTMGILDQSLAEKYPRLQASEGRMGQTDQPPCEAFMAGAGGFMKTRSTAAGNRVLLSLSPGTGGIMLTYSTPAADEWERRSKAARP